ncbi:sulfotransferase family protein [Rhabdothermincola salaria]|uniref:sulfotransferase family protein n=1 Tax=Rhabdothermincola salaria TaxID=2903142 RepID=UPI001E3456A1|nr:sulfotransferase [Rhabdothermincola salaria]MCD9624913.1 sulfotransferase [Rhabdothermincola salaria]
MSDTTTRPEPVRLDDLAAPRFSPEARAIVDGAAAFADAVQLDAAALMDQACEATGLDDFGPMDFVERLELLVWCLEHEGQRSPMGKVSAASQLGQLLQNRLLLQHLLTRHPEIHDVEIAAPMIIAGLPRTGTTHLHNLISADPALRSLPYWESLQPVPFPAEAELAGTPDDPRLARTEGALSMLDVIMPHFRRMHDMTTWHVHEEIQILAMDFSTMLFETMAPMPTWRDYYLAHDQRPHYEYMKTVLKACQFLRGGDRWILKSPQHLEQFGPLIDTFGDATVLVTHRDPVSVMISMGTMLAYSARTSQEPVDPKAIAGYWADRLETMLNAALRDRDLLPAEQSMDVRFDEFMADDLGMVRRIYDLADQPMPPESEAALADYVATHQRDRYGKVIYEPEVLGIDVAARRTAMRAYSERFAIPDEPW